MGTLIDDEILNTFAVVGEPEQIAPELHPRYGDVISRISFYAPYKSDPDRWSTGASRTSRPAEPGREPGDTPDGPRFVRSG